MENGWERLVGTNKNFTPGRQPDIIERSRTLMEIKADLESDQVCLLDLLNAALNL